MSNPDVNIVIKRILRDIAVELSDEFDKNFDRQGFFSESWQRRVGPLRRGGATLVSSGRLRRSFHSEVRDGSVVFVYDAPYASYHNEGSVMKVTSRMKKWFWHKYMESRGSFGRKKDGSVRKDKRTLRLSSEAEFWKHMALKKAGSEIRLPRRRFVGSSPEVERAVREIIEENLGEYFDNIDLLRQ